MNAKSFYRQVKSSCNVLILLSLLFLNLGQARPVRAHAARTNLPQKIFDNGIWWIERRDDASVPMVQSEMTIFVDGVNQGTTRQVSFGHKQQGLSSWPEIAAIYNTGYLRLVPFDLPWGTSFVLGPGYWEDGNPPRYVHNIQISRMDINTSAANGSGPIQLTIYARDYHKDVWPAYHLNITYNITLPDPGVASTKMQVRETYSVASPFSLSRTKQSLHEGFKWVQFSSMHIDGTFHDSDSAQYQVQNGTVVTENFQTIGCDQMIFSDPQPLSTNTSWVQVRHSDNLGWQGNTPNTIVIVNRPNIAEPIVPQGRISLDNELNCRKDTSDDNVGVWLNHESAPQTFPMGSTDSIEYTLIAQDDPFTPPPGMATLNSPRGAISDTTPTYTWYRVTGATWYYLWVNGPSGNLIKQWYDAAFVCGPSSCSVTPARALGSGSHTWWIRTWNESGYGPWSGPRDFSLPTISLPGKAALVSPSGGISDTTPTYTWNKVPGATWYYLWVGRVNTDGSLTPVHIEWYESSVVCSGTTCSTTPAGVVLSPGNSRWWIRTWNESGYGPWSNAMNFSLP